MPSTLSLLRAVFTDREQRRLAIAIWASGFAAGSALGPLVGGVLLEHFAWGSVFLLAVPVLVPMLVLVPLLIPESRDPAPGPHRRARAPCSRWPPWARSCTASSRSRPRASRGSAVQAIVLGIFCALWFVRRQLRSSTPMLDVRLFRQGSFGGAVLVNLFSVIALVGFLYFVSQHLQLIAGLSPVAAGLALLPGLVAMIAAGLLVVPIARRVRPRILVPVALGLSAAGYLVIALTTSAESIAPIVIAFVLLGVGIGAAETVSNELILSSAPPAKAGAASAVSETAYELGAVLGTAVLGSILAAQFRTGIELPSIAHRRAGGCRARDAGRRGHRRRRPARSDRGRPRGIRSRGVRRRRGRDVADRGRDSWSRPRSSQRSRCATLRRPARAEPREPSLNGRTAAVPSRGRRPFEVNDAQRAVGSSGVECSLRTTRSPVAGSTLVCEVVTERRLRARKTMPKITTTTPAIMRM